MAAAAKFRGGRSRAGEQRSVRVGKAHNWLRRRGTRRLDRKRNEHTATTARPSARANLRLIAEVEPARETNHDATQAGAGRRLLGVITAARRQRQETERRPTYISL